jgi:uncharacterized membrane protein YqhA
MFHRALKFRYIFIVVSIFTLVSSIFFVCIGVYRAYHGFSAIVTSITNDNLGHPGLYLIETLDSFLVAILFYIFSLGTYKLFISNEEDHFNLPKWLDIHSLKELKVLLWETSLVALLISSLKPLVELDITEITWNAAILPAVILILSLALYFMRKGE